MTFSSVQATPLPVVLISFLLAAFLLFEARRYQYFDIWNTRLRVIEACFYDPILRAQGSCTDRDWNEVLADELKRLRRNYGWIFAIQIASYWSKIGVHPTPLAWFSDPWERTAVGPVPGQIVLAVGALFYLSLLAIGVITFRPLNRVKRDLSPLGIAFEYWLVPSNTEWFPSPNRAA